MSEFDGGTDRLRPQCFNPNCEKYFESVNEMVAVPGRGDRSPRHFCESCAERIRRGPPITDGGTDHCASDTERLPMLPWCRDCWDQAADGTQEERDSELPESCQHCGSTEVFWI